MLPSNTFFCVGRQRAFHKQSVVRLVQVIPKSPNGVIINFTWSYLSLLTLFKNHFYKWFRDFKLFCKWIWITSPIFYYYHLFQWYKCNNYLPDFFLQSDTCIYYEIKKKRFLQHYIFIETNSINKPVRCYLTKWSFNIFYKHKKYGYNLIIYIIVMFIICCTAYTCSVAL